MKSIILTLTSLFIFQASHAQDAYKTFKMESIYLHGNKFVKNDIKYPVGIFSSNLANEMEVSPHAVAEWKKYKSFRNWSFITSIVGLGLTLRALTLPLDKKNLRTGLLIGGFGLTIASIPISVKSSNQLQKAIWTRNRDILQF